MLPPVFEAFLCLALLSRTGGAAPGGNINEFTVMCKLFTACEQGISQTDDASAVDLTAELTTMVAINLSAADDSFFERNFDNDKTHDADENYTKYKATWAALKKDLGSKKIGNFDLKLTRLPDSALRRYVQREALAAVAAIAKAREDLTQGPTSQSINSKLKEVLYGDKQATPSATADVTFGNTLEAACGNNGGGINKVGISLANDLVCLCGGGDSAVAECAGTGKTLAGGPFTAGSQNGPAALTAVRTNCHNKVAQPTTEAELQALLTNFEALIGARDGTTQNAETNYGKGAAATCTAGNTASCINYKYQLAEPNRGIPWVRKLRSAIADIQAHNRKSDQLKALNGKAKTMEQKLLLTYMAAQAIISDSNKSQRQETTSSTPIQSTPAGICKAQNKTAAECPSQKCDYDKEKGCSPKPGQETPPAGASAEDKKCSDKKKDDCKSPDCNWDGKECKDSSILVNKHFALSVVSAAFVALLF